MDRLGLTGINRFFNNFTTSSNIASRFFPSSSSSIKISRSFNTPTW
jgi:hypothetical protein